LLLEKDAPANEVEACFLQAIEVARRQGAKMLELRAAASLARLWQQQGRQTEARQLLAEIYDWFGEGFDTPDLTEARLLLETLLKPEMRPVSPTRSQVQISTNQDTPPH
jgi:predicted ATPase